MSNKEIAGLFHELASLMELHEENPFKIRSYENAYLALRKLDQDLLLQSKSDWSAIKGVGTAILEKLEELKNTGRMNALEEFRKKTPEGIRSMLRIKGLGPKKVKSIWTELQIESPGELLYACYENRLIELKGFGPKLQADVIQSIEYFNNQQGLFLYSQMEQEANQIIQLLIEKNPSIRIEITGELRRALNTIQYMDFLCDHRQFHLIDGLVEQEAGTYIWKDQYPVRFNYSDTNEFYSQQLIHTGGSEEFKNEVINTIVLQEVTTERELFSLNNLKYIPPECRDLMAFDNLNEQDLIEEKDIKGVIHNHSNYSDGIYSIEEMVLECIRLGYQYFVISDHSKSAFYANGLQIDRLYQQWTEIETLNEKYKPFKIFKSIESDILTDGMLDYENAVLEKFDLVIASVHSNLKMDEERAMKRLLKAIENPFTTILGHPTGRLLLSRKGYPVDYKKLIDACVVNHVSMEINANPLRLDMDWTWIEYGLKKGLMISINPDAHNLKGIRDIKYGVKAARKGGLLKNNCLNTLSISEFETWIKPKNKF